MNEPGVVIWLTGVPAAGKSTLAAAVQEQLRDWDLPVENLDADQVRASLSPNLGFTPEARDENTRRLAWLAQLLSRHGVNVLVAAVSPLQHHRDRARQWCEKFVEVSPEAGDVDMLRAMQAYKEVSYDGMIMPDHMPRHPDDPDHHQGFAFAYGYIRGLMQAVGVREW